MTSSSWPSAFAEVAEALAAYDPRCVSSLASGLDVPGSDLDVVCDLRGGPSLVADARAAFGGRTGFSDWTSGPRTVVAWWQDDGLGVEVVGAPRAVTEQPAFRHFCVQERLVALGGAPFAEAVRAVRRCEGRKTEPAICRVLGLDAANEFTVVDRLHAASDAELRELLGA